MLGNSTMWDSMRRTHLVRDWEQLDSSDDEIAYPVCFISMVTNYFSQRWPVKKMLVCCSKKKKVNLTMGEDMKNISETSFEDNRGQLAFSWDAKSVLILTHSSLESAPSYSIHIWHSSWASGYCCLGNFVYRIIKLEWTLGSIFTLYSNYTCSELIYVLNKNTVMQMILITKKQNSNVL